MLWLSEPEEFPELLRKGSPSSFFWDFVLGKQTHIVHAQLFAIFVYLFTVSSIITTVLSTFDANKVI